MTTRQCNCCDVVIIGNKGFIQNAVVLDYTFEDLCENCQTLIRTSLNQIVKDARARKQGKTTFQRDATDKAEQANS